MGGAAGSAGPRDAAGGPGRRIVARCDALGAAPFSDDPERLFRPFLGPGHAAALDRIAAWMAEAGMTVRLDAAANLIGRYEGASPGAPALLIGSHVDSVFDGGRYDGPLGIMAGIECVASLHAAGRRLPFAVEVIAFGDEEGSRFHTAMLCSRAFAGRLAGQSLALDSEAGSLAELLAAFRPAFPHAPLAAERLHEAARDPATLLGFVEVHIEQGPQLEAEGLPLGVVSAIAGQLRYRVALAGMAAHAGTTPMDLRRDALAAAAEAILLVEAVAREREDVVATVGRLAAAPGSANAVSGAAEFALDIRAAAMERRDEAAAAMLAGFDAIARRRGVRLTVTPMQDLAATPCDPHMVTLLEEALRERGQAPRRLASGAGHDAMILAAIVPSVMLFVRCTGGVSHHPDEHVTASDCDAAHAALLAFVERLARCPVARAAAEAAEAVPA